MVQGKINRGRHTDHPAGRHAIQTNQCPPPPSSPYIIFNEDYNIFASCVFEVLALLVSEHYLQWVAESVS